MLVACPDAASVSAALGVPATAAGEHTQDCSYNAGGSAPVHFSFTASTLAELRAEAEASGAAITELAGLGTGAFAYADGGEWLVRYDVGTSAATLSIPVAQQANAVDVAELFASASDDWPAPTVAPADYDLTCPSAAEVTAIAGGTVTATSTTATECIFSHSTSGDIRYMRVEDFGSVTEYRSDLELKFGMSPIPTTVDTFDFAGLGPGAFWWADASPQFVNWQMCDGVVVTVTSWHDEDVLRNLALLLNSRNSCTGGGAGTPSPTPPLLPSTGN